MRIAYFDCFSGISGDMALGALLDLGLDLEALRAVLDSLQLDGWALASESDRRGSLTGTRVLVTTGEQTAQRHIDEVRTIIMSSPLPESVKERSMRVFFLLAEAEGRVHGIDASEVHFHEVGAVDALIDIVGVVAGLEMLGVEAVFASSLPLGTGWVRAAHGPLPVPAPAVLQLLTTTDAVITSDVTPAELVTPTGAALLAALATFTRPHMRVQRIGYGLGARQLPHPNALRIWLGDQP